jgi:hypothetical protein
MTKKPKHTLDEALDRLRDHLPVDPSPLPKQKKGEKHDIVGRRDERGIPYPGDFPNPASDRTRGCF